ncbi:hypothetical protein [Bacillus sp. UNC438CL73TsuS30]|uniref:hypothetical protein n=1 Tax=Bacillus sp. UNC438CL73TsuS30 TaxID=1340434 RepID=UPI00047A4409|nr:hypothetical protein [Bacillus sp. UNC438CL73TsuS30]
MFKFFSFRKKKEVKQASPHLPHILTKLDRIIELLETQQQETLKEEKQGGNIHLEHVQIDHLENINFQLEKIEIDELSGKLLIGNNISGSEELAKSIIQKIEKENEKEVMVETASDDEQKIMKTPKGYRFQNKL